MKRAIRHWLRQGRPWVLGHRGARRRAPENTMASFELAREEGADGIELDVRLDRDGDVVVLHDTDLGRVTRGNDTRHVETLGRSELRSVDLGGGERVPRLEDVLDWARAYDFRVNVELKSDVSRRALLVAKVARIVGLRPHAAEWIVLSSFDVRFVAALARLLPWIPSGFLVAHPEPVPSRVFGSLLVGATAVHPEARLVTAASIAPWQRASLAVNVWTVNEPSEAIRLAGLGVDTLISDEPKKILESISGP